MGKHPFFIASELYFLAAALAAAAASTRPRETRASFVHHSLARPLNFAPRRAAAGSDESVVDPLDALRDDSTSILPPPSSSWDVADDWNELSSANVAAASFSASSSTGASFADGSFDATDEAARLLEEQEEMMHEWDSAADDGVDGSNINDLTHVEVTSDDFVENAVDMIASHLDYNEPDGVQLYDTASSAAKEAKDKSPGQDQEEEIAFMIRCNQSPQQLLVSQGRALPELTDEVKYAPSFLFEETSPSGNSESGDAIRLPLQPKATAFFEKAVQQIFDMHSVQVEEGCTLDRSALSKWMTKCISSPLSSSSKSSLAYSSSKSKPYKTKPYVIGPYDQSVSAILSRYSRSHGSGRLTLQEFQALYLEVAWSGYVRDIISKKTPLDHESYQIPTANMGVLIRGRQNTEKMLRQATLSLVWRDMEAHEIFSPAEEERVATLMEMEHLRAETLATTSGVGDANLLMDECELFDEYEERLSHRMAHSDDNDNDVLGTESGWDFLKRKEKGSHESVEMASDGETPKRMRDGKFVFIDEESCIGCTQCAQIAPSTFKMIEDTGRARAYAQSNSVSVEDAVMACPVTCMHWLSFDELKEMETARDDGDGRTDHRHFGGRITHTPLHMARRGGDANHKSSWYHYLKWKCHGSSSCPQRGCYDCPTYAPGQNPFFKERHRQAEFARAKDFIQSGEADKWRKVVEL